MAIDRLLIDRRRAEGLLNPVLKKNNRQEPEGSRGDFYFPLHEASKVGERMEMGGYKGVRDGGRRSHVDHVMREAAAEKKDPRHRVRACVRSHVQNSWLVLSRFVLKCVGILPAKFLGATVRFVAESAVSE